MQAEGTASALLPKIAITSFIPRVPHPQLLGEAPQAAGSGD